MAAQNSNQDDTIHQYFVPFIFEFTKYANGGPKATGHGNTMIKLQGGIRNWEHVMAVVDFIKTNNMQPNGISNANVIITGLFEVDQWREKEVASEVVNN